MRYIVVVFTSVLLGACQSTTEPDISLPMGSVFGSSVALRTDQQTYAPGAAGVLTLYNQSEAAIGYNLCFSTLERRSGNEWTKTETQPSHICTAELRLLNPEQAAPYHFRLSRELPAGEYRFHTTIERMSTGARPDLTSNVFQVR